MTNIKLTIEYHGLPYSGWQSQKDEKTVQDEIQKAIFKFSGEKKIIQGGLLLKLSKILRKPTLLSMQLKVTTI